MILKTNILIIFLFLVGPHNLFSMESISKCKASPWPFDRKLQTRENLYKIFKETQRDKLTEYMLYEMFENPKHSILMPLLHYLNTTETHDELKGYFENMGILATNQTINIIAAMEKFPKRVKTYPLKKAKKQICDLYIKSSKKKSP